jgi:hypothetical protein
VCKFPYKKRYIAGFSKCSTKPLSKSLNVFYQRSKLSYGDTNHSKGSLNQTWILKNLMMCLSTWVKCLLFSTIYIIQKIIKKTRRTYSHSNTCTCSLGRSRLEHFLFLLLLVLHYLSFQCFDSMSCALIWSSTFLLFYEKFTLIF